MLSGEGFLPKSGHLAKDRVHKSCGGLMNILANPVDRFVDRRVIRNAVEEQEFGGASE